MAPEPVKIVLAEDDDGHATLTRRSLERAGVVNPFVRVRDGQEALDWLRGEGAWSGRPAEGPPLLLLDVQMPRVDGVEVLRQLKADPRWAAVPVIVLSTTDDPREVERCRQLGCDVCVTKPVSPPAFVEAVRRVGLSLQVVRVPPLASTA
jgi:CheY-like chemotaxis protein